MNEKEITELARQIRLETLKSLTQLGFGHYGGSMSVVETLAVLYGAVMKIDPADPDWPERDYFVLSKGHAGPALYSTLAIKGYFPLEELSTLNQNGTRLPSHPDRLKTRGVDATTGSLGQGISIAGGMALSHKLAGRPNRVFCIVGDGELNEGNIWEAAMFAGKYQLSQLIGIIDRNNIQIGGSTEDVMPLEDLKGKWESFGWHVQEIDGHNMESIIEAASMARAITNRPSVIIAHTIPGKGVDFMEYDYRWHGMAPNHEQAREALEKLRTLDGALEVAG